MYEMDGCSWGQDLDNGVGWVLKVGFYFRANYTLVMAETGYRRGDSVKDIMGFEMDLQDAAHRLGS